MWTRPSFSKQVICIFRQLLPQYILLISWHKGILVSRNAFGQYTQPVTGKNSWIKKCMNVRVGFRGFDAKCECAADALVSTGLAAKGYNYVNLGNESFVWMQFATIFYSLVSSVQFQGPWEMFPWRWVSQSLDMHTYGSISRNDVFLMICFKRDRWLLGWFATW